MGITHLKEFQKPALLGLVKAHEEELFTAPKLGDRFLPDKQIFSNNFAYDVIKKSNHIAAYIGFGAEPPVMDRDAVATRHGELAKVALKYIATEEELLALNQARSTGEKNAMIEQLTTKAVDLLDALRLAIDTSKLQAVLKGEFSYNKNGVKIRVDYGVPDEQKHVLTGDQAWNTPTGLPITNLIEWNDQYVEANKTSPDVIFITREILRMLQTNPEVLAEAGVETGRAPVDTVRDVLSGYGLPSFELMDRRYVSVKDVYTGEEQMIEIMPKHRVVFAKEGLGNYLMGPTAENNYQPGIDLSAYDKFEPIQSIIRVATAGFPVVENPHLLLYADVAPE
ncbi:major capsid protein [Halalkalibacterium halodurans]|uniref:major capsid protein n=1 Tax=Halalkalibacterium halodurans TaxID=86665 RepID=UPI002E1A1DCA|nr:major capsid protein [Halalkalibacterium halodurans]